jgi:hypothetical protein
MKNSKDQSDFDKKLKKIKSILGKPPHQFLRPSSKPKFHVKTSCFKVTPVNRKSMPFEPKSRVSIPKSLRESFKSRARNLSPDLEKQINIKIQNLEKKYNSRPLFEKPKMVKFSDSNPGSSQNS